MTAVGPATAADRIAVNGFVEVASDSLWRGLSLNDGRATPGISLSLDHGSGITVGAFAFQTDIGGLFGAIEDDHDPTLALSLDFSRPVDETWVVTAGASLMEVFRPDGRPDWDWWELRAGVSHASGFSANLGYAPSLFDEGWDTVTASVAQLVHLPRRGFADVEIGVHHIEANDTAVVPFARVGVAVPVTRVLDVGAEYQFSGPEADDLFAGDRTGSALLLRLTVHFEL